ncbi:hypothetical protein SLS62_008709 [Diatrype stigma]|uniref:Telomere-associated protein Rif1 N-terminal domain-containing protein n=1 Tax=Diatrype stigma TaxID=117547 RepID=A0AAN9YL90_9PEZI
MVSQATVSRGLDTLPARPPTPPREKQQAEADSASRRTRSRHSLLTRPDVHTPPSHSPDSCDSANPSSRRTAKKVDFSTQPDYREPPTYNNDKENGSKQRTPITAPSSTGSTRLIKSILKPSSVPNPLDPSGGSDDPNQQISIAAMLESTVKQLAGADRDSKLDAYMMLVRALKASNNLPDRIALQDQMGLFMQFIQRDVTARNAGGLIDSSLTNHALTLLSTFLYYPAIASTLSYDFGVFIMDYSIRCFEDSHMPKDVIRHLMQVVASQDFSPKVMTADRVGRLIAALHKIEDHLKGKSIVMSRIIIYRRLIKQSKLHMVSHSDWLLDLFTDMLSSMKEIRAAAVALGFEAIFTIGKEKQLSRKVMDILQLTTEEVKYIEYFVQKLLAMAANKQESAIVPQIWSVIILLLRGPVEKWEFFSPWLEILQRCFNSGDPYTRFEANYAWNRLVYVFYLNESSLSKTIGTVCQPFYSQLKRKYPGKQQEDLRRVVLGSICNLYYYAFKPNSTSAQVDHYWLTCVRPIMQKLANTEPEAKQKGKSTVSSSDNLAQAMMILTGLFDSSTPRIWKENRIAENPLVKPAELPAVDPKWIRRNADKVFAVIEPIVSKTFLDMARPQSPTRKLWHTLISAVAAAASKEVKVSNDTANFVAYAFNFLLKLWSAGPERSSGDGAQTFVSATREFLSTMIEHLGLLPFTESRLSMSKQNTFVPVATPSHRPGKGQGLTRTPLLHLFSILSTKPPQVPDDDSLLGLFKSTFNPFLMARAAHARNDFANELMRESMSMDVLSPYGPWLFISEIISSSADNQSSLSSNGSSSGPTLGHEYREIVKHLERGIKSTPNLPWEHWQSLFRLLVNRVTDEAGEAGCAIAVIEPLAKVFLDSLSTDNYDSLSMNTWKGSVELIATAKQPRDRQALDAARRRLWGTPVAGSRSASFDPFDNFYRLTNRVLEYSYVHSDTESQATILPSILKEVSTFLTRCSGPLVFKSLTHLQPGICVWVQDTDGRYNSKQPPNVSEAVNMLWGRVCDLFADPATLENFQLDIIEPLLCAAFESKHKHIVNTISTMWNRAFDQADDIQYPEKLKMTLLSIRPYVELVLPGLDVSSSAIEGRQPAWVESQDDFDVSSSSRAKQQNTPHREPPSSARSTPTGSVRLSLPKRKAIETTPDPVRPKSAKQSSTPRLRHDDSQIQFAAIQSSPAHSALDSQHFTDRQKEVRERQRETAVLFPEIRSSPEGARQAQRSLEKARQEPEISPNKQVQASTPEAKQRFEDYVSSTPTPRRGQATILDDHDMDDVPSSPPAPDPRRNLLSEMKPRSRSASIPNEYPFASSPPGSPTPNHRELPHIQESHDQITSSNVSPDRSDSLAEPTGNDATEPKVVVTEATNESREILTHPEDEKQQNGRVEEAKPGRPTTPPTALLLREAQETPKPDNDVCMDTPASSAEHIAHDFRSAHKKPSDVGEDEDQALAVDNDRSFELSDGEERSMARLIVELDSRKCEPMPRYGTDSPEKPLGKQTKTVIDCITVDTGDSRPSQGKSRKTRSGRPLSPILPSSPAEGNDSQPSGRKARKKRKRSSEKAQEPGGKKARHRKFIVAEDADAVPDSQVPMVQDDPASQDTASSAADIDEAPERSETSDGMLPTLAEEPTRQEPEVEESRSPRSDGSFDSERESEAVHIQLWNEASQETYGSKSPVREAPSLRNSPEQNEDEGTTEMEVRQEDVEMAEAESLPKVTTLQPSQDVQDSATPEKSSMEKIMGALKLGLDELRTATLSREEVYKIEDMFMDIKRELYQAESRGRT